MPQIVLPMITRAFETVRNIRKRTAWINKVAGDNGPLPLWITLLRYALHATCFNTINKYQKLWALAAACSHAQAIYDHGFPQPSLQTATAPPSGTLISAPSSEDIQPI